MVLNSLRSQFGLHKSSRASKQPDSLSAGSSQPPSRAPSREPHPSAYEPITFQQANSFPPSEAEAKNHINQIRAEKGLDGTDSNTADLEAALIVLSEQLYQKSTHFLLELIQNVDDNSYAVDKPTLNISYENRQLRIDCNEDGFSRENVAAICRIGRSSKSGLNQSRRYIGEKGIGFKSVFKVSDAVWIRSGHYSFQFDKNKRLGMIAPIWTDFPARVRPGYTSILLQLSKKCKVKELLAEIKALDPRLLIFLQKLKRINITILDETDIPPKFESRLARDDDLSSGDEHEVINLRHGSRTYPYRLFRRLAKDLPRDPKRVDITESEILLAFPLDSANQPRIVPQNAYAFLPIRDYGFKFLLQADFVLIASREDIDSSSRWNKALLKQIPHAFHDAIKQFNKGELRYSWLPYLPFRPYVGDFFKHLENDLIDLLEDSPILETISGQFRPPHELIYISENFTDHEGKPLVLTASTKSRYLSHKYSVRDWDKLHRLGVTSLTTDGFMVDLKYFILEQPSEFHARPKAWHSRLAQVLVSLVVRSSALQAIISALEIVPLREGKWTRPDSSNLLFPSTSGSLVVPKGIDVAEIDPEAAADYARKQLFSALGAKEFQKDQICEIIVRTHERVDFSPKVIPTYDLVSHVVFLYNAGWHGDRRDLWFFTESNSYCHGSDIYMDSDVPYSAKAIFGRHRTAVSFLHQDYYQEFSSLRRPVESQSKKDESRWQKWLVDHMNVAQLPRIATPAIGSPFSLSNDFEYILKTLPSTDVLLLFKHHWAYYSRWIIPSEKSKAKTLREVSQQKIRERISHMEFKCRGGPVKPLNQTFLPSSSIQLESIVSVPFLDVPSPDDDEWDYLRHFGVVVDLDAGFFLECIRRLKDNQMSKGQLSRLYGQLNMWVTRDNAERIRYDLDVPWRRTMLIKGRHSFQTHKLLFIPMDHGSESQGEWVDIDDCVWDGPDCLRVTSRLKKHYPEHQSLFHDTLQVPAADITTLVREAQHVMATDTKDRIADLLVAISRHLDNSTAVTAAQALITYPIFPIVAERSNPEFDFLSTAAASEMWFIPDLPHLKESFEGMVPLLALETVTLENLPPLFSALGLEQRLLSKVAKGVSKSEGKVGLHTEYTKTMRKKVRCIARLVPKENPNRMDILRQLRELEVFKTERIVVEWIVKSQDGTPHYGRADAGRVALTPGKEGIQIHLTAEDIDSKLPPLELQEEFAKFAEINEPKHVAVLLYILIQDDIRLSEEALQRRGIPNDVPEFDTDNDVHGDKDDVSATSQPKTSFVPRRGQLHYRLRRRPIAEKESEAGLSSFISKVERISNLKKTATEPWGDWHTSKLLARICVLENQDAFSLLPQGSKDSSEDLVSSLFDKKSGLWKETVFTEEDPNSPRLDLPPMSDFSRVLDPELQFIGELSVSKFFEMHLGHAYIPSDHWTSQLRSKAGHAPFEDKKRTSSTFTFGGESSAFASLLTQLGGERINVCDESVTFHMQVVTSKDALASPFNLDYAQVEKAKECSTLRKGDTPQIAVYILTYVYDVYHKPQVAMFIDPWKLHVEGSLELHARSSYQASIKDGSAAICLQDLAKSVTKGERPTKFSLPPMTSSGRSAIPGLKDKRDRSSQFLYRPLHNFKEIRLLDLLPGKEDDPLEGVIRCVPVNKPGRYCALSYVWGAALKPFHLHTSEGKIAITVSLNAALKSIRDPEDPITLWVDALCIDQDHSLEKSVQLRLMRRIFQSAESVIAWLGEEKNNSHEAIETLLQIRTISLKPDFWPRTLPAIPSTWGERDLPPISDKIWGNINTLLARDWFRRCWIVQELVAAVKVEVFCGRWILNWDDFVEALQLCKKGIKVEVQAHNLLDKSGPAYALGMTRQSRLMLEDYAFNKIHGLLDLLSTFSYTKATLERDKLFALLGLASDGDADAFNPDYESPLADIIKRYATEFVKKNKAMDLLYRAGTSKSYPFCSWIPGWTKDDFPRTISSWQGASGRFSAGGNGAPRAHLASLSPFTLSVQGKCIDKIVSINPTKTDKNDIIAFVNSLHASIDALTSYPTGESRAELKLKLPIGNARRPHLEPTKEPIPQPLLAAMDSMQKDWPPKLGEHIPKVGSIQELMDYLKKARPEEREVVWHYWRTVAAFAKRLSNGMFCVTGMGFVGLAPGDAEVGDGLCVFKGGGVPFVVRGGEGEGGEYRLVGEAYVHGWMYGEGWEFRHVEEREICLV